MDNQNLDELNTQVSNVADNTVPLFEDVAETIPKNALDYMGNLKRGCYTNLDPDNLVFAVGVEVFSARVKQGSELVTMPILKMLTADKETQVPIYVFAPEAGSNYRNLSNYIDHKVKVAVSTLRYINNKYIAEGSIRQAEYVIGKKLFDTFNKDPEKFKSEERLGTITQVIDTNTFGCVFFEYEGMQLGMLARNYYYQTWTTPLSQVAQIGYKIPFKIEDIQVTTYEEQEGVKRDIANHLPVPKGTMYQIMTTRLPFLPSPDTIVSNLLKKNAEFKANIVRCHPVKGILVEIAPGWLIKGFLNSRSPFKPSIEDAKQHTAVVVRLMKLDQATKTGRCLILRFPHGVAKTIDPHNH